MDEYPHALAIYRLCSEKFEAGKGDDWLKLADALLCIWPGLAKEVGFL